MFGKVGEAIGSGAQSVIQEGVSIVGKVQAEGEIRIDGVLEGALVSKARVTVGPKGMVRADIEGIEIVVQGKVSGNLVAKRIELRKGARVEGDLSTQALVIEDGVYFQGMSQ